MPYSAVAEKLKAVPDSYLDEVSEFLDFILFKSGKESHRNGLDKAIEQVERGEVDYYDNFDDLVKEKQKLMRVTRV